VVMDPLDWVKVKCRICDHVWETRYACVVAEPSGGCDRCGASCADIVPYSTEMTTTVVRLWVRPRWRGESSGS
jgi:hypothetical protein